MNGPHEIAQDQSNWVTIEIPCSVSNLYVLLSNIETLLRLNPYLDIRKWEAGPLPQQYHLVALNEMNGFSYDQVLTVEVMTPSTRILLRYGQGLKDLLEVNVAEGKQPEQSILTLREYYHPRSQDAAEREQQLKEVDHSLVPWGNTIREQVIKLQRWGRLPLYRWYREKFWLSLRPTHRRIVRLLIWATVLEFLVFLFIFAIYWSELTRVS